MRSCVGSMVGRHGLHVGCMLWGGEQLPNGNTDQTGPITNPDAAVISGSDAGISTGTCTPAETHDCY